EFYVLADTGQAIVHLLQVQIAICHIYRLTHELVRTTFAEVAAWIGGGRRAWKRRGSWRRRLFGNTIGPVHIVEREFPFGSGCDDCDGGRPGGFDVPKKTT